MACDNLNPDFCSPCISGCFCKLGLVFENSKNWTSSRCIPISKCPKVTLEQNQSVQQAKPIEEITVFQRRKPVKPSPSTPTSSSPKPLPKDNCTQPAIDRELTAAVQLFDSKFKLVASFVFSQNAKSLIELVGTVQQSLLYGEHALAVHAFGDPTAGCRRVGPVYHVLNPGRTTLAFIGLVNSTTSDVRKVLNWPEATNLGQIAGRSLAIHESTNPEIGAPIACGVIGLSKREKSDLN
ncbi:hypothetical protein L596_027982 [Steinernema carpocapsae]|uniref:Superoxide dismutase copper/zinc binding domain-containing protein n=1 Tax=Steinernema carpocapsae TaxID=34508 RepID=A0A4U5LX54_STECR|nr:hypothetical protein L596_027982 [Steinernema carpocapsae]